MPRKVVILEIVGQIADDSRLSQILSVPKAAGKSLYKPGAVCFQAAGRMAGVFRQFLRSRPAPADCEAICRNC